MGWTQEDYVAALARLEKSQPQTKCESDCTVERKLHDDILDHCKKRGWIALHGSMAHVTYRPNGEGDFTLLLPEGRVLFIECKTATGKMRPEQLGMQMWMDSLGHKLHVVRSFKQFIGLINGKG